MKCYNVKCVGTDGTPYEIGVIAADEFSAKYSAEYMLLEGKHVKVKAVSCEKTDRI